MAAGAGGGGGGGRPSVSIRLDFLRCIGQGDPFCHGLAVRPCILLFTPDWLRQRHFKFCSSLSLVEGRR